MEHFLRNVKVDEEERFLVSLPCLDNHLPLPDNFNLAFKGLQVTTHKLKKENLFKEYGDVFKKRKREGIIGEVLKEELRSVSHYLPHRHVMKPDSTTKIRSVFNASSKQKGTVSLNDCLEKGLNLIELIPSMLARFRLYRFGVSADIRKAFLQISLYQEDRNFLRFFWHSEEGKLINYRHCRELFYVDNCLASVQTQSELDRFIDVATEIIAERKFDLRGWEHSNPSDPIESPINVLGMIWDRHCDTLSLNIPDLRELMEESKTRIAPCGKKETTIAKLELLGAAISARLSTTVLKEFPTDNVYFWTDSTTVLAWLKREEPWGVFVYNRVQEIRKLTPIKAWRYVPGSLNPADCSSIGCSAKQLCSSKWWEGPRWLHLSPQEWHISDVEVDVNEVEVNKERRATMTSMMNVQTTDIKSYEEFKRAEVLVFKSLQSNAFQDERLLAKMQAFRDEDGLLRIRTKLADSYEKEDFKFPILLPANDVVVKLIREEHVKAMHAGSSILRARLREKFWIIRAKRLVKQVRSECVICKRYKAKHVEVPFAPLSRDSYSDKGI
ncbi:integrase_H2C2 domain-containing protein [Trichonephila clavipes]|nr:integrase_H2C2 domain-containing protein [Trichonephila clavipes]